MGKRVLIVDDEQDVLDLLEVQLKSEGYGVLKAKSGEACLGILDKEKPDVILLDINMPGMSGWEVCSKIRFNPRTKSIPILFVTAKIDDYSQAMGKKGADGYIIKPFDTAELVKQIKKVTK